MQFTVIIPDSADPKVIDQLAQAVHAAGGTVMPEEGDAGAAGPMAGPPPGPGNPLAPPGGAPAGGPPLDMGAPLPPGGPGAGMLPGPAMAAKGARALRPRPGQ